MSTWFSKGFAEAEKMSQQGTGRKRSRNYWARPGEPGIVRFLIPAYESFNYKRCFVPGAQGQKLFTSPGVQPDPFVQAGYQLQAAFAWPIIDRREIEFDVEEDGKTVTKSIGPRYSYFADGQRTRKALIAFEKEMLNEFNEERADESLEPVTLEEYNLTSYDIKLVKESKAPWQFYKRKAKPLSTEDKKLVEEQSFDLMEELKPLPLEQINVILSKGSIPVSATANGGNESYSYGDDQDNEPTFFS